MGTNSPAAARRWADSGNCAVADAETGAVIGAAAEPKISEAEDLGFELGDRVAWSSPVGGPDRRMTGHVVAIVQAGELPPKGDFPSLHAKPGPGKPRDHVSYVVAAKGRGIFWPVAKALTLAEGNGHAPGA